MNDSIPAATLLAPGARLDDKYEIVELLGVGGMGEVYKARHLHLGAFRCIKVMKATLLADPVYRHRFLTEARLATQIHHPNVAVVHDFAITDGSSYMVTEFIDGQTLRQWEEHNGRFPLAVAVEVTLQILTGLEHIHRRGLLHRDISTDNVMLSYEGDGQLHVKIIDLGVAKDVSKEAETTQAGVFMGNPKYMSPEQLGELPEGESLDGRADLYSLGVVLYEMLAGVPPYQARTASGYIVQHLTAAPPRLDRALEIPRELEAVVLRCLEKDRRNRFADARELAAALAPWAPRSPKELTRTLEVSVEERKQVEAAWSAAVAADTYGAYREFRAKFPNHRVDEAERAIAERMAFESAAAIDTEDAWSDYLERWSADRHSATAEQRLEAVRAREETAYSSALAAKSAIAWSVFLDEFPDGPLSGHAQEHLREALMFDAAKRGGRLQEFLNAWPDGLMAKDARRALARLAIVEGDFNAAWEAGTVAAWDHYLATYPDSPRADEARRNRQEAQEYELAASLNTPQMWRAFLKAWPEGRHRLDVEIKLRSR